MLQDLRHSFRNIRQAPGFSLVVILTLALGIGANTSIFSVLYAVLLRPLPYPDPGRLVQLGETTASASNISVTWMNLQRWRQENHSFQEIAGFETQDLTMTGRGNALLVHAGVVSSGFFGLTGARPLLGRPFTEADDQPGAAPVAMVANAFWRRMLSGNSGVLGTSLTLNGTDYQVVGVLPEGFRFFERRVDLYLPLGPVSGAAPRRNQHGSIRALALLKPGVTPTAARADLDAILHRWAVAERGPESDHRAAIAWLADVRTGQVRPTLLLLMGAVVLVLLIACANVMSLLLARYTVRAREFAIRRAIGAGRLRLARQVLTENLLIAAIGGALGVGLAAACFRMLTLEGPRNIPRLSEVGLNLPVLTFAVAVTVLVSLLTGLAPVFAAGRVELTGALKDGSAGAGSGNAGHSLRGALVVTEIALTVILLFASALLLRSLAVAQGSYPGFNPDGVLALELQLPTSRYKSDDAVRQFYSRLLGDLAREHGVQAVGAVNCPPSAGDCGDWWYSVEDRPQPSRAQVPLTLLNAAGPAYFQVMEIPVLAGRAFTDADRDGAPRVVVINQEIAHRWWRSPELALGHRIKLGGPYMEGATYTIVGVSGNVRQLGMDTAPLPEMYFPFSQRTSAAMVVMIRTTSDPEQLIPAVRRAAVSIDRNVPIQSLQPFERWLGATLERRRFSTFLLTLFAALAAILAAVGTYGVLIYSVASRRREIAIRMALGAHRPAIVRWAGKYALRLVTLGAGFGALGAWAASHWLSALVFGVSSRDPGLMMAAIGVVIGVAALAASVPVWRATKTDPVRYLHEI